MYLIGEGKSMMQQNDISKYRNELFGLATIMVVACHSTSIINYSGILNKIVTYGGIGVYIFSFLSGIGLYFSLRKSKGKDIIGFYKRRFQRVLIPYFLIAGIWYGVLYLGIKHSVGAFIYELSTLSFWVEHKGAWYVAMLVPIYLIYPWLNRWLEKGNKTAKNTGLLFLISFVAMVLEFSNYEIYKHLSQIFVSVMVFLIGNHIAQDIYLNTYNGRKLLFFLLVFIGVRVFTPINEFDYICDLALAFSGIVIVFIGVYLLKILSRYRGLMRRLVFWGKHSLEVYLTNIFILQAIVYWDIKQKVLVFKSNLVGQVLLYLLIIIAGILLSVLSRKVIEKMVKVFGDKNEVG